jgi:hypothetical protein
MRPGSIVSTGAIALVAACGGGETTPDGEPGPCWPLPASDGGEVEIGTGELYFEPMPDTLTVIRSASQSDPFLMVHSRIRGMPGGNPGDPFDPRNPRTKVSAEIPELGLMLGVACPASLGYVPSPEQGAFDLQYSLRIGFGMYPVAQANGKQARMVLEVVGSNKRYARAEKVVTLSVPP